MDQSLLWALHEVHCSSLIIWQTYLDTMDFSNFFPEGKKEGWEHDFTISHAKQLETAPMRVLIYYCSMQWKTDLMKQCRIADVGNSCSMNNLNCIYENKIFVPPKATTQRCPAWIVLWCNFYLAHLSKAHIIFSVEPFMVTTKFSFKQKLKKKKKSVGISIESPF